MSSADSRGVEDVLPGHAARRMSFLYEYSGFPRRPIPGDPGPFPRFHARLAEAEVLLASSADGDAADPRPGERPDGGDGRRADRPRRD
jgi:hypothetical protein